MPINPAKYSAIIFDLGGVLLNIDYSLPILEFKKLGVQNFDALYGQAQQETLFDDLETGKITPENFYDKIRAHSNLPLSDQEIKTAWNSILLDFPENRLELLVKLKQQLPIFLLSNTNEIHVTAFEQQLKEKHSVGNFSALFTKLYYSCRINDRKPNVSCFQKVIRDNHLQAESTLFIDDSKQHVLGAQQAGLQAVHLTEALENVFEIT